MTFDPQSLTLARRHCVDGAKRVQAQQRLIARMSADGLGTLAAESLLETLEETQRIFMSDLHRLEEAAVAWRNESAGRQP